MVCRVIRTRVGRSVLGRWPSRLSRRVRSQPRPDCWRVCFRPRKHVRSPRRPLCRQAGIRAWGSLTHRQLFAAALRHACPCRDTSRQSSTMREAPRLGESSGEVQVNARRPNGRCASRFGEARRLSACGGRSMGHAKVPGPKRRPSALNHLGAHAHIPLRHASIGWYLSLRKRT